MLIVTEGAIQIADFIFEIVDFGKRQMNVKYKSAIPHPKYTICNLQS